MKNSILKDILTDGFTDSIGPVSGFTKSGSPLVLAYLGDAVFDLYIRTRITGLNLNDSVHSLHKKAIAYVNAKSQSDILNVIHDELTEEENNMVRRGRNAKSGTIPKNANIAEYKRATGFETLLGYLYIKNDSERLKHILNLAFESRFNAGSETVKGDEPLNE